MEIPQKLRTELPYDLIIPLLGIYPKECKSAHNGDTCTPMFIAELVTVAMLWNQPRCPSTNEYINKMWYRYTM
jgi:hypothetical protein